MQGGPLRGAFWVVPGRAREVPGGALVVQTESWAVVALLSHNAPTGVLKGPPPPKKSIIFKNPKKHQKHHFEPGPLQKEYVFF